MQYPDDADLDAAITSHHRRFGVQLLVDWDRDGQFAHAYSDLSVLVDAATTDRMLESGLEVESTIVEGTSAAELQVQLVGRRKAGELSAVQLFAPYSTLSPLYGVTRRGAPVQYSILVYTNTGVRTIRQFTGRLREITASADAVTLRALDLAEDLRLPVTLPVYAHRQTSTEENLMNSQWVIDYILRQGGYRQSPPPVSGCRFAVTLHGAGIPEGDVRVLGPMTSPVTDQPWRPGKYGLALYADATTGQGVLSADATVAHLDTSGGNTVGWGMWIEGPVTDAAVSDGVSTQLDVLFTDFERRCSLVLTSAQQLQAVCNDGSETWVRTVDGPTLTGARQWRYVGVEFTFTSTETTVRFNVDGTVTTAGTDAFVAITQPRLDAWRARIGQPAQCLQQWQGTTTNNWSYDPDFVANAVLSPGMNKLSHLPTVVDEPGWDVLKEVVHAEYGTLFADEYGIPHFSSFLESRAAKLTTDREFGPAVVKEVTITDQLDPVVNCVTTETTLGVYQDRITAWEAESTDQLTFNPGTWDVTITDIDNVMSFYQGNVTYISDGGTTDGWKNDQPLQGFYVVHATNGTATGNVTVSVTQLTQRSFQYRVVNGNAYAVRLADKANTDPNMPGSPRLRIGAFGQVFLPSKKSLVEDTGSIVEHGRRTYPLPAGRWSQSYSGMLYIATALLDELGAATPVLDRVPVVGDPRIQITDSVPILDPAGLGDRLPGQVIGTRRTVNSSGCSDDLALRLLIGPGQWLLGDPAFSVLGETTILS